MSSGVPHSGRVALVTGGAHGIGQACAKALAAAGAKVHVVDLDGEAAEKVAAEIGGWAHVVDLAETVEPLPDAVDILVNNAGLQHVAPIHEFPAERFALLQAVMVTAPFLLIRKVLPHMYASGWGRIVNISSAHGLRASPFKAGYVTAKHGLEGLSKVAALEGAPHGVTSNCVFSELFNTRVRYSGASVGYQLASLAAGAVAPLIATALLKDTGSSWPISVYVAIMCVVTVVAVLLSRETRGVHLGQDDRRESVSGAA